MGERKVAVVVGVGPGLGAAAAKRFARGGYAVGLMARGEAQLAPVKAEIDAAGGQAIAVPADATSVESIAKAFAKVRVELGEPEVLVYNAGAFQMGGILDVTPEDFERCWRANCFGGFAAAREVLPSMVAKAHGTVIFTGATASLRGSARFSCLAVGKFGLRALAQSIARELGPKGIHVAHVVIDGGIDTARVRAMRGDPEKGKLLSPDAIAETYWQIHVQDPTAWVFEMDLRPAVESF